MSGDTGEARSGAAPIRRRPGRFLRPFLRAPVWLYRLRLGWLLGQRFLLLTHTGRKTGKVRQTVLEVVHREPETSTYFITSGWGETSQWYRNVLANPEVGVRVGRRTFKGRVRRLSAEEAEHVLEEYARRHQSAARALWRAFGSRNPHELAQVLPVLAVRPVD
jgi:deazaflavin-dependent oxidoreductase (nitroreductase family)